LASVPQFAGVEVVAGIYMPRLINIAEPPWGGFFLWSKCTGDVAYWH
jgi:hypothetical protein